MTEKASNLTRRKFIAAGSAAIAAPFVIDMAGKVTEAMAEEKKTYYINDNCCLCLLRCKKSCPVGAISFDGEKMAIDPEKCIRCGTCMKVCEVSAVTDSSAKPDIKPHDIVRRSCDVLVLGGGTSGLIAAAIAGDLSGKKVILLEKAKKAGGSGMFAGGVKLFSTKWHSDAGFPDQMDDYIRSAMNATNWELNPRLVANSFHALPAFFDWFCTWGKPEELFNINKNARAATMAIQLTNKEGLRCTPLMKRMIEGCNKFGVEILTEHTATEFIMGDKGEISGVKVKDPGGITIINCKYCLVSTGNVINCGPLMERGVPEYAQAIIRRSAHRLPTNTGDGVLMAEKAGVPIDYKSICVTYTGVNSTLAESHVRWQENRAEALYINLSGRRWVNETFCGADGFTWWLVKQPKNTFFAIMDNQILNMDPLPKLRINSEGNKGGRSVESGVPSPNAKETATQTSASTGAMFPGASNAGFGDMVMDPFGGTETKERPNMKELRRIAALPGKNVVIADTIEELADKMGVDRATFMATVKRYNELCAKGYDDDYFKPTKYLLPIEKGPFIAFSHFLGMDGAVGGIAINENMQVTGENGPINNLYAAGDTTGSRFINRDGERSEIINDMTWAVASGFLAGQNIGKQLKKID
jgi:fumarate reductase flavoprotein subunit